MLNEIDDSQQAAAATVAGILKCVKAEKILRSTHEILFVLFIPSDTNFSFEGFALAKVQPSTKWSRHCIQS